MPKTVIILAENGVQDQEFFYPLYRLQEADCRVEIAGSTMDQLHGKHGIKIQPTMLFTSLWNMAPTYDGVIVPGGWECPEKLRQNELVLDFLRVMDDLGKPIGAICHGPWVLISAGIIRNRMVSCYKGMKDDLINAGGAYKPMPVTDGNLVSAPHYNDNPTFMVQFLEALKRGPVR